MVFLVQPVFAYIDGELVVNEPVTKTLSASSSSDALCNCVTGEFPEFTTRWFTATKQRRREATDDESLAPEADHGNSEQEIKEPTKRFLFEELDFKHFKKFSLKELRAATSNFSNKNRLGQGGFGHVYRGELSDGCFVAVKRLSKNSKQGESEFQTELQVSSMVMHRNLLRVYGYCTTGKKKFLVYPLVPKGDLLSYLRGLESQPALDWTTRKKIALGVAQALTYMHEYCPVRIIHRDVKPSNILLGDNFEPLLTDFGIARPMGHFSSSVCSKENQQSRTTGTYKIEFVDGGVTNHITTDAIGTLGYIAPESIGVSYFSEKSDVYAFGVTILELATGSPRPFWEEDEENEILVDWVRKLVEDETINQLADLQLEGEYVREEMDQMIKVGLLCTSNCPKNRPRMFEVIAMLRGMAKAPEWNSIIQEFNCKDKFTCCPWLKSCE